MRPLALRMAEHAGRHPGRAARVTMSWCGTCVAPLPPEWTTCPGCELYGSVLEALAQADAVRATASLLEQDHRLAEMRTAAITFSAGITEAASLFRIRRGVLGQAMNDLQAQAHASARNRRRNRAAGDGVSLAVRVGTDDQPRRATSFPTTLRFPPPAGWALVW